MSIHKKLQTRTKRRFFRTKNRLAMNKRTEDRARIAVFRSSKHIYAQIIDDKSQQTLVSASSLSLKGEKGTKKEVAERIGLELGKKAQEKSITGVYFDRGHYMYHGRIAALAEGLRKSGLNF